MAEIAEQIGVFLAHGTGPTEIRPKKKKFRTNFLPNGTKNFFGPIPWQAAEIIGVYWPQSHRVTE